MGIEEMSCQLLCELVKIYHSIISSLAKQLFPMMIESIRSNLHFSSNPFPFKSFHLLPPIKTLRPILMHSRELYNSINEIRKVYLFAFLSVLFPDFITSSLPLFDIAPEILNRLRPAEPGKLSHPKRLPGSLFDDIVVYSKRGEGEVFKHFSLLALLFPCARKWFSLVSKRQWKVSISGFVSEARGKKCCFEGGEGVPCYW